MNVLIIGAGITGLVAAHELQKLGHSPLLVEKEAEVGGSIKCMKVGDFWVEQTYHVVFPNQENTIKLIEELGFKDKLKWYLGSTGFYHDQLFDATTPTNILKYPRLKLKDRFNIFKSVLNMRAINDFVAYDYITAKEFVSNYSNELYEQFYKPMIIGKFGDFSDQISATWLISRMSLRNKRKWNGEVIGYPSGSLKQVIDKLSEGKEILLNSKVEKLNVENSHITSAVIQQKDCLTSEVKQTERQVDAVISTIPPQELNKIVELPQEYFDKINLPYEDLVCGVYSLKKPLSKHFWINFMNPKTIKFLLELTNIVPLSKYGQSIVYLGHYTYKGSELWNKSEEEVERLFTDELKERFAITDADILFKSVSKVLNVCIVGTCDAMQKIRQIGFETPVKNLYVAGMFNCYPTDSINLLIEKAKECVKQILN